MRKLTVSVLAAVVLIGALMFSPAGKVVAQSVGGSVAAAYFQVLNSAGNPGWRLRADSAGVLNIENVDTAPATNQTIGNSVQIDDATGALRVPGYTVTQLTTLQSPGTGYMLWATNAASDPSLINNHTSGRLFISTWTTGGAGSGLGAWTLY